MLLWRFSRYLLGIRESLEEGIALNRTYSEASVRGVARSLDEVVAAGRDPEGSGFFAPFRSIPAGVVHDRAAAEQIREELNQSICYARKFKSPVG